MSYESLIKSLNFVLLCSPWICTGNDFYPFDDSVGVGRRFDGVGAISGGGATSKLLVNYPEPQRSQVLDFLFKPSFGCSLQLFKVEIGGDAQSSEGTESSHMHEEWDENYKRGYEWWMMSEAKKRNPNIKLYGLPWGWPGWLGDYKWWPYKHPNKTADYITRWIAGAKKYYNLDIDYIGIWNEKPYTVEYIKSLRTTLDLRGFNNTRIVAADMIGSSSWEIVEDMLKDPVLNSSIDIVGAHYPFTYTTQHAKECGKPLWSTEDFSVVNNELGAGCMARLLNRNYIDGLMTNLIAWNIIYSYYDNLDYSAKSLMTANQPWSGYYEVKSPVWATAHTTQFTQIGWYYLKHDYGVGYFDQGGSYVTFISPDKKDFSIVIETMDTSVHDFCVSPPMTREKTRPQNVSLQLDGHLLKATSLHLWSTKLSFNDNPSSYLSHEVVKVIGGTVSLYLDVNAMYTLTTLSTGHKGSYDKVPPPKAFPVPYNDSFEAYQEYSEAYNFAQQVGVFEVRQSNHVTHGQVMRQVMVHSPIHWCPEVQSFPLNVIGNHNWTDVSTSVDVYMSSVNGSAGVYLAARVEHGGCTSLLTKGLFFFLHQDRGLFEITLDLAQTISVHSDVIPIEQDSWYTISLDIKGNTATVSLDGKALFSGAIPGINPNGFVAVGTSNFGLADFDNFVISKAAVV